MKRNRKLSPKGAVWLGLLSTPALVMSAVVMIGVVAGSAGPSVQAGAMQSSPQGQPVTATQTTGAQTLSELQNYWTPERIASAQPYPMPSVSGDSAGEGSVQTVPQATGPAGTVAGATPGGAAVEGSPLQAGGSSEALTEPYHADIPFSRWAFMGAYRRYPASTIHKMFFTQDHDGNGTGTNFVCSSSTIGSDGAWTAGHCINNGLGGTGLNAGWSYNIFFCPSYDNGFNVDGCWGADDGGTDIWTWSNWYFNQDLDADLGGADTTPTSNTGAGLIGNSTGWLGMAWNFAPNQHWVSFGYPAGAPFNGNKIMTCQSSLGYTDSGGPVTPDSSAMGCDMTGGSSGGPWILSWGFPGQQGGGGNNWLNGHNDWRHTAEPGEMASPYFDTRACTLYEFINDVDLGNCP